jgi:hypothetical protein
LIHDCKHNAVSLNPISLAPSLSCPRRLFKISSLILDSAKLPYPSTLTADDLASFITGEIKQTEEGFLRLPPPNPSMYQHLHHMLCLLACFSG